MGWLSKMFSNSTAEVIKEVGDAIDKNMTTEEEKLKLKIALEEILFNYKMKLLEIASNFEVEITKRWQSDNMGSKFTKYVRPAILVYLTIIVTILAVTDGNFGKFVVKSEWIDLFQYAYITTIGAYFGGRTLEKTTIFKKAGGMDETKMEQNNNPLFGK